MLVQRCGLFDTAQDGALAQHQEAVRLKPEGPGAHGGDANQVGCPAGSMYPFLPALFTVAVVSTAGACLNYELSARLVRDMVVDLMPGKLSFFHRSVSKHQENLLSYFVFLRVRARCLVSVLRMLQNCIGELLSACLTVSAPLLQPAVAALLSILLQTTCRCAV
jgi:hypothetical protein